MTELQVPSKEEFLRGIEEFEKREKRDAMYKVATFLVKHFWGEPADMADALGVLLLTWNQAHYRYGSFDFEKLEKCIADNMETIASFRGKDVFRLGFVDKPEVRELAKELLVEGQEPNSEYEKVKKLFNAFLDALRIASGTRKDAASPVAVAKALHLLAPSCFPLWDYEIAKAYGCSYYKNPAEEYVEFCRLMTKLAEGVTVYIYRTDKTLLKLIDEYNYSRYTQQWV